MNKNIKYIIEKTINFNPVDYQDEDPDLIDRETLSNLTYKYFPNDKRELELLVLQKLIENIEEPYLNDIDTSEITDMSELFSHYKSPQLYHFDIDTSKIKKLDLSKWNTFNVTNMNSMFDGCSSLETFNISDWDVSNVTDMNCMFENCISLKELDLSGWDTSNVTSMRGMFGSCKSLEILNISDWNVSKVNNMAWMFANCVSLKKFDISKWNTANLSKNNIYAIFSDCDSRIIPDWYYKLRDHNSRLI